jgi:hypothetical protein
MSLAANLSLGKIEQLLISELRANGRGSIGDLCLRMGLPASSQDLADAAESLERQRKISRQGTVYDLSSPQGRR